MRRLAGKRKTEPLPVLVYSHNSLIRRKLGNVDMHLQENKAVNLTIAAKKVNGILIKPGECFSFWHLVGSCPARKGYREGLAISLGRISSCIGGGMCQFTNLIHWMILHTPLEITEHHHHDGIDLFPDYGRKIPFGTGTSVMYNYLDYRFVNNTQNTFQLLVHTTNEHLCGELRTDKPLGRKYHIKTEDERFTREEDGVYRNNHIYKECVDVRTGNLLSRVLIKKTHAKVMYDTDNLVIDAEYVKIAD